MSGPIRRVGYWWSQKKSRKFNFTDPSNVFRLSGLELVKLNLEQPLEDQGPFAVLIHKLSNVMQKANDGDAESKAICQSFQEYAKNHPETVIMDPLPNIEKLLDRYAQYKLVEDSKLQEVGDAFIPPFVELTTTNVSENLAKMKLAGVTFPCVCKPSLAHGSSLAHEMCLIFNEEGLKDISVPCVAQKFINHNAVLYKVFVIGDKFFLSERSSLKNFSAGAQPTIFFHSHDISKPHSASALTELDESEPKSPIVWPDKDKVERTVQTLCDCSGLLLFGIDFVVDNTTGRYGIVDINYFPGYDEIDDFFQILCDLILRKIALREQGNHDAHCMTALVNSPVPMLNVQPSCKQFTFDTMPMYKSENSMALLPYVPLCFYHPTSSHCSNAESGVPALNLEMPKIDMPLSCDGKCSHPQNQCNTIVTASFKAGSPDSTQDDSGIETSDSCDEKKKKPGLKTAKRQHSRLMHTPPAL